LNHLVRFVFPSKGIRKEVNVLSNLTTRLTAVGAALIAAAFLLLSAIENVPSVSANSVPSGTGYASLSVSSDTIYNWDFDSSSPSSTSVDWGVRFIFKSNAAIDYIKNRLDGVGSDPYISPYLDDNGGQKYAYVDDGPEGGIDFVYDNDSGIKEGPSCDVGWDWGHMRLYVRTSSDSNYNIQWGYYVIATNHRDFENGACSPQYHSYESDESDWNGRLNAVVSSHGWSYSTGYQSLQNA
jgi:hypothetical protein